MIDDPKTRRKLLDGPAIAGRLGDDYFAELHRRMLVDVDPHPRVVLTGETADGTIIRVVDLTALGATDDQPIERGFLWIAMVGNLELVASRRVAGQVLPGQVRGSRVVHSTASAQDALLRARHVWNTERPRR